MKIFRTVLNMNEYNWIVWICVG